MLSRALATPSRGWKKSSPYCSSVVGPTWLSWATILMCGFMRLTASAATSDFSFCKRNATKILDGGGGMILSWPGL